MLSLLARTSLRSATESLRNLRHLVLIRTPAVSLSSSSSHSISSSSRDAQLNALAAATGDPLYPDSISPTSSIEEYVSAFRGIPAGSRLIQDAGEHRLCGRILSIRPAGRKMCFYEIAGDLASGSVVQVLAEKDYYVGNGGEFQLVHESLRRGDVVAVEGFPGKSQKGELSIIPRKVTLLSPCLNPIPSGRGDGKFAIKDKATRYKNRHVDLLANRASAFRAFQLRSRVVSFMRRHLEDQGFMEVETPMMGAAAGGANAKPFRTTLDAQHKDLFLRISPELPLKMLVIGGMEKVFEIGRVFRNEGQSANHNPEFTTCEVYKAYADYNEMMAFSEELLQGLVSTVAGSLTVEYNGHSISFQPPFRRISVIPTLEERLNLSPGQFPTLDVSDEGQEQLLSELHSLAVQSTGISKVELQRLVTPAQTLDYLIGELIEPDLIQPTFLCDHPVCLSPLAKEHRAPEKRGTCERFELFIAGKEVANAYSELNDPTEQEARFRSQAKEANAGDDEAMPTDADYVEALRYGLPPTGGWGIGIDRLVMIISGKHSIRDVILFPVV